MVSGQPLKDTRPRTAAVSKGYLPKLRVGQKRQWPPLPGSQSFTPRTSPALPSLTSAAQRQPQHLSSAQVTPARAAPQCQFGETVPLASLGQDARILWLLEDAPHVAGSMRARPPPQSLLQTGPDRASGSAVPGRGLGVPPGSPPAAASL